MPDQWPPPGATAKGAPPDSRWSKMTRSAWLFLIVFAAMIAVAGGFKALFVL